MSKKDPIKLMSVSKILNHNLILMKKFFLLGYVVFINISLYGQANRSEYVPIASPTAASLGKVADIPVNYHTGIPDINIPIYTVREGPLKLPIDLAYHASGLKVMEQASWVGAGWSLNSGGVITRSVRGNADEKSNGASCYYLQDKGYYNYLTVVNGGETIIDYFDFANGKKDGEPDLFFFNVGGYSGKFYFRADKTVAVLPQQDIQVKRLCGDDPAVECSATNEYLSGWIITTPDGTKYYFGKTADALDVDPVESTDTYSFTGGMTYSQTISSWYLYKIQSADQVHSINLQYVEEDYGFYALSMFPRPFDNGGPGMELAKNLVNGVRLNQITFSNNTVTFIPEATPRQDLSSTVGAPALFDNDNTNAKALKQIRIEGTNFDKTFEFSYAYFTDSTNPLRGTFGTGITTLESMYNIHTDKKRLKLLSMQERSTDNTVTKPPHLFTYYDEASVPRTLSFAQDHWGFYNGATSNEGMFPYVTVDGTNVFDQATITAANREAAWPSMRAGSLRKITYPTGGYTDFNFEAHENGYVRQYFSYEKSTEIFSGNAGFMGADYTSPSISRTLAAGKYLIEMDGTNLLSGAAGQINIGSTNYGVSQGSKYSKLIDVAAGTYTINVSVSGSISTGHGVMGKLYNTNMIMHTESPLIGGLRIASIKYHDAISALNDVVQTFDYKNVNGESQGVLFSRSNYVALARNEWVRKSGVPMGGVPGALSGYYSPNGCLGGPYASLPIDFYYVVSPGSIHPMRTTQGSHIGYNQVKVTQADGGYTIYKYRPSQNASGDVSIRTIDIKQCNILAPNYPPAPEPHDFSRGDLRSVSLYSFSGTLVKENHYLNEYELEQVGVTGLIVKPYQSTLITTEYEIQTAKKKKSTNLEWAFNATTPGLPVGTITETFFESPNHTFDTRTVVTEASAPNVNSLTIANVIRGKVISEQRHTYVADVVIPSCTHTNEHDNALLNALGAAFTAYNTAFGACLDFNCKYEKWQDYIKAKNQARLSYATTRKSYYNTYNTEMNSAAVYNAANTELKALIDLKNRNQIAGLIENSRWRNGNFLSSTFTTYQQFDGNKLYIYPSKLDVLNTLSPQAPGYFTALTNSNNTVVKDTKYLDPLRTEETYLYKSGFLVEVTGKSGLTSSYIWDSQSKLPIVKAINVSYSTLFAAYTAVSGNLNTIRGQTSLSKAQITTYTYDPLVGMKSQTDANNFSSYFFYDKLGRLDYIKDKDANILQAYEYKYKIN